jgi:hypothetical protein
MNSSPPFLFCRSITVNDVHSLQRQLVSNFSLCHSSKLTTTTACSVFWSKKMQTRKLGNSDLNITRVGFGAWAIGGGGWEFGWGNQEDNDSIAAIKRALELGVNWIDTAAVYGTGHSEEVVAKALAEWQGARPYIFTKCSMVWDEQRKVRTEYSADSIRRECEASLRRLRVSAIFIRCIGRRQTTVRGWKRHGKRWLRCKGKAKFAGSAFPISMWSN